MFSAFSKDSLSKPVKEDLKSVLQVIKLNLVTKLMELTTNFPTYTQNQQQRKQIAQFQQLKEIESF